jgi:hypothetical protein
VPLVCALLRAESTGLNLSAETVIEAINGRSPSDRDKWEGLTSGESAFEEGYRLLFDGIGSAPQAFLESMESVIESQQISIEKHSNIRLITMRNGTERRFTMKRETVPRRAFPMVRLSHSQKSNQKSIQELQKWRSQKLVIFLIAIARRSAVVSRIVELSWIARQFGQI